MAVKRPGITPRIPRRHPRWAELPLTLAADASPSRGVLDNLGPNSYPMAKERDLEGVLSRQFGVLLHIQGLNHFSGIVCFENQCFYSFCGP